MLDLKNPKTKLIVIVAVVALVASLAGYAVALAVIEAPEHAIVNPQTSPTPTPTAAPTEAPQVTELHLSSNASDPFWVGDTLTITGTVTPAQTGANVSLYNLGNYITSALTDESGVVTFYRTPINPADYTIKAEIH